MDRLRIRGHIIESSLDVRSARWGLTSWPKMLG